MDRTIVACGVACVVAWLGLSGAASAAELDGDGLSVDFSIAPHCIILPRSMQTPASCPNVDLASEATTLEASLGDMGPGGKLLALVDLGDAKSSPCRLVVMSMPSTDRTPAHVGDMLAGLYNSMHPDDKVTLRTDPRLDHDDLTIAGAPALRYVPKTPPPGHLVAYYVYGASHMYGFLFTGVGEDVQPMSALAERVMAAVQLPSSPAADSADPTDELNPSPGANPKSKAYKIGRILGMILITGLISRVIKWTFGRTVKGAIIGNGATALIMVAIGFVRMRSELGSILIVIACWFVVDLLRVYFNDDA